MFTLKNHIHIDAPIERCFLLSTSLAIVERELHLHPSAGHDPQTQVPYRTSGLVTGGDRIRWEGWQFGLPQIHVSLISAFEPPTYFQDSMIAGRFKSFQHDHYFTEIDGQTLLNDAIRFSMPLGPAGKLVGKLVLVPHIETLLKRRFVLLKRLAETEEWRKYLP